MDAIKQSVIVICGIKNSGKTTLIRNLIPKLNAYGYKVATVKHDGHEFESDVPGTDSYYHQKAGAYGTVVFSKSQFMMTKKEGQVTVEKMIRFFPEADLILVEGCKDSKYPKIEVIRSVNGNEPVSNPQGRFLIVSDVTDVTDEKEKIERAKIEEAIASFEEIDVIVEAIIKQMNMN